MNPSSLQLLIFVAASSCFLQDPHSLNKKLQLLWIAQDPNRIYKESTDHSCEFLNSLNRTQKECTYSCELLKSRTWYRTNCTDSCQFLKSRIWYRTNFTDSCSSSKSHIEGIMHKFFWIPQEPNRIQNALHSFLWIPQEPNGCRTHCTVSCEFVNSRTGYRTHCTQILVEFLRSQTGYRTHCTDSCEFLKSRTGYSIAQFFVNSSTPEQDTERNAQFLVNSSRAKKKCRTHCTDSCEFVNTRTGYRTHCTVSSWVPQEPNRMLNVLHSFLWIPQEPDRMRNVLHSFLWIPQAIRGKINLRRNEAVSTQNALISCEFHSELQTTARKTLPKGSAHIQTLVRQSTQRKEDEKWGRERSQVSSSHWKRKSNCRLLHQPPGVPLLSTTWWLSFP